MSKVVWDVAGERDYEQGVSKVVLYKKTTTDPYGLGVAWSGVTQLAESPEGAELTDLYADGIKYASLRSVENYKATLEAYTFPDEYAECDGSAEPVPGIRLGQQKRVPFGLSLRSEIGNDQEQAGEGDYILTLIYGVGAMPSERTHATINDGADVEAMSWELNTTPVAVAGYKPTSCMKIYSSKFTPDKMAALEDILYGKDAVAAIPAVPAVGVEGEAGYVPAVPEVPAVAATVARLPLPAEVITLMAA